MARLISMRSILSLRQKTGFLRDATSSTDRLTICSCLIRDAQYAPTVSELEKIDFGLGAAQQEQHLTSYFYRSGSFKRACSDKVYLILGPKGAGKSAIFRMLQELHEEITIFQPPNLWVADEPQLREHCALLQGQQITSAITLWRFYIASLVAKICVEHEEVPTIFEAVTSAS